MRFREYNYFSFPTQVAELVSEGNAAEVLVVVEELVEATEVMDVPLFPRDIISTIEDVSQTIALLEEDLEQGIRNVNLEDVSNTHMTVVLYPQLTDIDFRVCMKCTLKYIVYILEIQRKERRTTQTIMIHETHACIYALLCLSCRYNPYLKC